MWKCAICAIEHDDLPLCFGAEAPWRTLVAEADFDDRVELTKDQCVVDGKYFFIRGHIEIPIHPMHDTLALSVWVSLSEKSFLHCSSRWENPDREGDGYFGWLSTPVPIYPDTIHLKTNVRSRAPGLVPLIELQECDHPLYRDQRDGISAERFREIVHELLHS
jgi:hypothetical protein